MDKKDHLPGFLVSEAGHAGRAMGLSSQMDHR